MQRIEMIMQRAPLIPYESEDAALDDVDMVKCTLELQQMMMKER